MVWYSSKTSPMGFFSLIVYDSYLAPSRVTASRGFPLGTAQLASAAQRTPLCAGREYTC